MSPKPARPGGGSLTDIRVGRRRSLLQKWRNSIVFNKGDAPIVPEEHSPTEEAETQTQEPLHIEPVDLLPRLPPELCDRIIDHLFFDRRTLSACALTCRAWLPASRLHLFRHIRLQANTIPPFLSILIENPAIGVYVEDLMILVGSQGFTIPEVIQMKTLQSLKEILDRLPAVKSLRIPVFFRISVMETLILSALSKSLQAISFSGLFITDLQALSELLASFPHLQSVGISNEVLWLPAIRLPPPRVDQDTTSLPLRHLRICVPPREHGAEEFVKWLDWRFRLSEVRSACIRYGEQFRSRGLPSGVSHLLSKLGPSLEKLELVMPRDARIKGARASTAALCFLISIWLRHAPRLGSMHEPEAYLFPWDQAVQGLSTYAQWPLLLPDLGRRVLVSGQNRQRPHYLLYHQLPEQRRAPRPCSH